MVKHNVCYENVCLAVSPSVCHLWVVPKWFEWTKSIYKSSYLAFLTGTRLVEAAFCQLAETYQMAATKAATDRRRQTVYSSLLQHRRDIWYGVHTWVAARPWSRRRAVGITDRRPVKRYSGDISHKQIIALSLIARPLAGRSCSVTLDSLSASRLIDVHLLQLD